MRMREERCAIDGEKNQERGLTRRSCYGVLDFVLWNPWQPGESSEFPRLPGVLRIMFLNA